ncbi:unnamed protein product [Brassica rapa]|uniref:Uncharacterized protein n=1 Tax=Brassica campestris TaxID=3711 RepID=A0A8D9LT67_BRACM|nr:unnamed protein product [Brassica rapa]
MIFGQFKVFAPSKHLFSVGLVRHIKQRIEIASLLDRCVISGNKLALGISTAFRICCATLRFTITSFVGLVRHIKKQSKLGSIKRLSAPLVSPFNPPVLPFSEFISLVRLSDPFPNLGHIIRTSIYLQRCLSLLLGKLIVWLRLCSIGSSILKLSFVSPSFGVLCCSGVKVCSRLGSIGGSPVSGAGDKGFGLACHC